MMKPSFTTGQTTKQANVHRSNRASSHTQKHCDHSECNPAQPRRVHVCSKDINTDFTSCLVTTHKHTDTFSIPNPGIARPTFDHKLHSMIVPPTGPETQNCCCDVLQLQLTTRHSPCHTDLFFSTCCKDASAESKPSNATLRQPPPPPRPPSPLRVSTHSLIAT